MSEKLKNVVKEFLIKNNVPVWYQKIILEQDFLDRETNAITIEICTSPQWVKGKIHNPSLELQKLIIREAGYEMDAILICPGWQYFDDEFEQEILDNMMIKDIIK